MFRRTKVSHMALFAPVLVAAMVTTACGGGDATDADTEPAADNKPSAAADGADAALADALPDEFRSSGKLTWAVEPYFPPFQMTGDDDETLVGLDIDLANEISALLGVEAEIEEAKFDALIPGIQANRYDLVIDAMSDTEERRELVNFVDYFQGGSAIFVAPGNPEGIKEMGDLCGLKVGAVKASFQVEDAEAQRDKCAADGKDALEVQVYPDQAGMLLALSSGRSDAMLMDSAAGSYAAKQSNGSFETTGSISAPRRKGIVVSKENEELMTAVQQAVQSLMDDGRYGEILAEWGQESGAIEKATINDGKGS